MTARQRALLEKRSDNVEEGLTTIPVEPLLALPSGNFYFNLDLDYALYIQIFLFFQ